MNKVTYLSILVIALIALNAVALVFIWRRPLLKPMITTNHEQRPGDILAQSLGFSRQQQERFDELRNQHRSMMIAYSDSIGMLREKLHSLLVNDDSTAAWGVITMIGNVHQYIEQATYEHFAKVRLLCTPKQRQQYDRMVHRAITEGYSPSRGRRNYDDQAAPSGREAENGVHTRPPRGP